jgi:hypothetical protein
VEFSSGRISRAEIAKFVQNAAPDFPHFAEDKIVVLAPNLTENDEKSAENGAKTPKIDGKTDERCVFFFVNSGCGYH